MRVTDKYIFFWGSEYSQWYASPFSIDGIKFNTAEQYMMYMKAMTFGDKDTAIKILRTKDPSEQKRLGRQVKGFEAIKWDEVKEEVVFRGNVAKFSQNSELRSLITMQDRGKIFVEASPNDTIWGIGLHETNDDVLDESKWKGQNLLGKTLNRVQAFLLNTEN